MNERFRELREQAFDYVQYQLSTVGSDYPVMQAEQLEMINQKFAELIVKECVDVVSDAVDHREPASTYAHKILNHFGIDQ